MIMAVLLARSCRRMFKCKQARWKEQGDGDGMFDFDEIEDPPGSCIEVHLPDILGCRFLALVKNSSPRLCLACGSRNSAFAKADATRQAVTETVRRPGTVAFSWS